MLSVWIQECLVPEDSKEQHNVRYHADDFAYAEVSFLFVTYASHAEQEAKCKYTENESDEDVGKDGQPRVVAFPSSCCGLLLCVRRGCRIGCRRRREQLLIGLTSSVWFDRNDCVCNGELLLRKILWSVTIEGIDPRACCLFMCSCLHVEV